MSVSALPLSGPTSGPISGTYRLTPLSDAKALTVPQGVSIATILRDAFPGIDAVRNLAVFINGAEILPAVWARTKPKSGTHFHVAVRPRGDGAKQLLQTVLTVAIAAVAIYFGVPPELAFTLASAASALITNALIPPPGVGDSASAPQTYSIEGARNSLVQLNEPAPLILGTHRIVPKLLAPTYQEVVGDDTYLRGILLWAGHDIELSDLNVGETPWENFTDTQLEHSLTAASAPVTLYPGPVNVQSVGAPLLSTTEWVTRTTGIDAETIEIIGTFPGGLGWLKGERKLAITRGVEVQYREVGGNWQTGAAPTETESNLASQTALTVAGIVATNATRRNVYQAIADRAPLESNDYQAAVNAGPRSVSLTRSWTRGDFKPFPFSIKFAVPPGKQYEVRMRRTVADDPLDSVADDIFWSALYTWQSGEISPDSRLAVTAFRIKASEQLNGVIDTFNALCSTLCPVHTAPADSSDAGPQDWSGSAVTNNPADLIHFVTRGDHNAITTRDSDMDWRALSEFHSYCAEKGLTFEYVVDQIMVRGDLERLIAASGRGRMIYKRGRKSVVIDRPKTISGGAATARNAFDFQFEKLFPAAVHAFRIPFTNRATGYRLDERYIFAPGYSRETAKIYEDFPQPGKTDAEEILTEGSFNLRTARELTLRGRFSQDIEYLAVAVGDRIAVPHNLIEESVLTARITRLITNGSDLIGVQIDESPDFDFGDHVLCWRRVTDEGLLEASAAQPIEEVQSSGDRIMLTTPVPLADAPKVRDIIWIGRIGNQAIDALVKSITPTENWTATIEWIAYAPTRFDPIDNPGDYDPVSPLALVDIPPAPTLGQFSANDDGIYVGFEFAAEARHVIDVFEPEFRETPGPQETGDWEALPLLSPAARSITLPAGRPGATYDVRLRAVSTNGAKSAFAVKSEMASYAFAASPTGLTAVPGTITAPSGAQLPVVTVSVDTPDDPAALATLIIDTRESGSGAPWKVNTTASADNPVKDLSTLRPGQVIDIRAGWRSQRGAITPYNRRPVLTGIIVPDTLVSSDSVAVGGVSAATLTADFALIQSQQTSVQNLINFNVANGDLQEP